MDFLRKHDKVWKKMVTLQILSIWYFILLQDKVAKWLHEPAPSLQFLFTIGSNCNRMQLCKSWYTCIRLNYTLLCSLVLPQKQPCKVCNSMHCYKSSIMILSMKYLQITSLAWKEVQDYERPSVVASRATMSTEIWVSFWVWSTSISSPFYPTAREAA